MASAEPPAVNFTVDVAVTSGNPEDIVDEVSQAVLEALQEKLTNALRNNNIEFARAVRQNPALIGM